MAKCQKCRGKGKIKTIDGHYCNDHLPACFCRGCGELVSGIHWHEMHISELGVCGNCVDNIRTNFHMSEQVNSVSFFTFAIEHLIEIERSSNMATTVQSVKVPGLKTTSKDEQILRYASESHYFREEASGLSAVLYLLVDELAKQTQFASIREQVEKHLTDNKPTLAAETIRKHLEQQGSRRGGAVIPDGYGVQTYGGDDTNSWLMPRPVVEEQASRSAIIPDGSSLEERTSENKTSSYRGAIIPDGTDFEPITY